jgi:two-component system, OmpR family, response regulator QseB
VPYSFAVVDDDELLRHLIERTLTRAFEDCRISEFHDGAQALKAILEQQFDLIVVDDRMPRVDGHEVVTELRTRGIGTPAIMLSNAPESEPRGRAAGITDFLYKADLNQLPDMIRRCIGQSTDPGRHDRDGNRAPE